MLSKARSHYPQIKFKDGKKLLWNPILKKAFINRPEERVRLQLIEYFTLEAGFSPHRLSFESPVKLIGDKSSSRTDIVAYDDDFTPFLLVECKSGDIILDENAARQVARYHQKIKSPYVLLTNGIFDYWFYLESDNAEEIAKQPLHPLGGIPNKFQAENEIIYDFSYWKKRGFAGKNAHTHMRNFLLKSCHSFYVKPKHQVLYLDFDQYEDLPLANYYAVFTDEDSKVAVSLSATAYGGTYLNVILNQDSNNRALMMASLDLISQGESSNTEIHSEKGRFYIDLISEINFNPKKNIVDFIAAFKEILLQNS